MRFETLIERYHGEIHSYLWRMLAGGSADGAIAADDLTQEVFLRAYRGYARLRANSNHRAWLYKIATNCACTALKRGQRRAQHHTPLLDELHAASGGQSPPQQAIHAETLAAVRAAIDGLPPRQRAALLLRYVQGLGYAEIAQALDCSQDSARANVYQAVRRLRAVFAPTPATTPGA